MPNEETLTEEEDAIERALQELEKFDLPADYGKWAAAQVRTLQAEVKDLKIGLVDAEAENKNLWGTINYLNERLSNGT